MRLMRNDAVKTTVAVTGAFLLVLAMGTLGWAMLRPDPGAASAKWQEAAGGSSSSPDPTSTPDAVPTTATPTPAPSPRAIKKPTATKKPTPIATKKPPPAQLPPPPPAPVAESPSCEQHLPGSDAPFSEVSAALVAAGAKEYWAKAGLQPPSPVVPVPKITVPANLMKAIAWTESTWRSTIISCDHGVGLMQVMAGTRDWMNTRFGTDYDMNTVSGNTALGATYLEWLTMYFGAYYFGTFDLNATAAVGDGGVTLRLRDVVIAAYNVGYGALENLHGTPNDSSDDTLSIPNQWYVDRVTGYMTSCPCLSY
jgi:soluble lytic murein transglycosylase-like protein